MSAQIAERARRANGIPADPEPGLHWARGLVRNPWTWVAVVATLVYVACLTWMYVSTTADVPTPDGGVSPGLNRRAITDAAGAALPTLAFWIVAYLWLDRYRPQRPLFWYLALGWGAAVSTAASMAVNTWAAEQLANTGGMDPSMGARTAVFVAPFVEEATKATVLFWIALAFRYRLLSRVGAVVLGGLSAAGFAFTENILYYARVIVYSSVTIEVGDPEEALSSIVFLRGFVTAFGHPLFTTMTALGLVVALGSRSKVVRVLAPLVGFVVASFLHMAFNAVASLFPEQQQQLLYFLVALPLFLGVVVHLVRQVLAEGRRHRERLTDFVQMGWLPESDVWVFSRQRSRLKAVVVSATYGWRSLLATLRLQRTLTELAHLRDAQVRGTIDAAGNDRARVLLERAEALRGVAVDDPRLQKAHLPTLPRLRWPRPFRRAVPPSSGEMPPSPPAAHGTPPVGSRYSPVDPRWGPPKG